MLFDKRLIEESVSTNVMTPIRSRINLPCCSILIVQLQMLAPSQMPIVQNTPLETDMQYQSRTRLFWGPHGAQSVIKLGRNEHLSGMRHLSRGVSVAIGLESAGVTTASSILGLLCF